ncbi:MAG: sodium/proline symporter [Candidatus Algichlamydia australiensis]|nr:sodium/proline symporter [Chlamydiales bacterium]
MLGTEIFAVLVYVGILFAIAFLSFKRRQTSKDFILGGRSLGFWLTAFAAHSSDMSSWLLMGYPAVIFGKGLFQAWVAVGLVIFMFINWHLIAPRIRMMTERYGSMTFSSYFESRFADTSGWILFFTALMQLIFYAFYITAGLVAMGLLIKSLFGVSYHLGITISVLIVIPYLFIGGYRTLAFTDAFQALFMLAVLILVPILALGKIGSFADVGAALQAKNLSVKLLPNFSLATWKGALFAALSWGLGYFGQPHIITKFMGIQDVKNMYKSKYVGMSWQIITLGCATMIGLMGVAFFPEGVPNTELLFVDMVRTLFFPFLGAFVLCAILAATISTMDSQILVLASSFAEDFYKRMVRKNASSKEILFVSRLSIFVISLIAWAIAYQNENSIYHLVEYAWYGLGSAFGPLIIASLYAKRVNKYGAWAGILIGGGVAAIWPLVPSNLPTLLPGFTLGMVSIFLVSWVTRNKNPHCVTLLD